MAGMSEADKARGEKKLNELMDGGGNILNPFSAGLSLINNGKKAYQAHERGEDKKSLAFGGLMLVDVATGGKGGKVMRAAKPLVTMAKPVIEYLNGHKAGFASAIEKLGQTPSAQAIFEFANAHKEDLKNLLASAKTPDAVKEALQSVVDFSKKFFDAAAVLGGLKNNPALRGHGEDLASKIANGASMSSQELAHVSTAIDDQIAKTAAGPARAELEKLKTHFGSMKAEVEALEKANTAAGGTVNSLRSSARSTEAYDLASKQPLSMTADQLKAHKTALAEAAERLEGALSALPTPMEGVTNFTAAASQVSTLKTQLETSLSKVKENLGLVDQQSAKLQRTAADQAKTAAAAQASEAEKAAAAAQQAAAQQATKAAVDTAKASIAPSTKKFALTAEIEGNKLAPSFRTLDEAKNKARVLSAETAVEADFKAVASAVEKASVGATPEVRAALEGELKKAKATRDAFHGKAAAERHELDMPRTDYSGPVGTAPVKSAAEPLSKQFKTAPAQGRVSIAGGGPELQAKAMIDDAASKIPANLDVGQKLKVLLERVANTSGLSITERKALEEAARAKFF